MKRFNVTKETVGKVAKVAGTVALYGLAVVVNKVSVKDIVETVRYNGNVKYSDAVSVIMDSDMFSSDKSTATTILKNNKDAEYYKAVIKIAKSTMYSSDKVELIAELSAEES